MKKIGTTDQGGILLEMTAADLNRFQQAMEALADLLVSGANHGLCVAVEDVMPPPPAKVVRTGTAKRGATKPARTSAEAARSCVQCGDMFDPPRKDSRFCSKACIDKDWRAKKLAKEVSKEKTSDMCVRCGKSFIRKRKDQTCCSAACRRKIPTRTKPEVVKPDTKVPARVVINDDVKKTRLETLGKLVKKDAYVPPEVRQSVGSGLEDISEFRQAQREASRE